MRAAALAVFGWLVPGGAYLLMRRYAQAGVFAFLVLAAFGAGLALHGGFAWPHPAELQGLDGFTVVLFRAGAAAKLLAGLPCLVALAFDGAHGFLDGRVHEYGTTLLVLAGLINLLAISSALELRKAER